MTIVRGVDETGEGAFYDVPDSELAKYRVNAVPMTDEIKDRLFPGKGELTKEDAQGAIPIGPRPGGEVEGYAYWCWYYVWDAYGNWVYWEGWC